MCKRYIYLISESFNQEPKTTTFVESQSQHQIFTLLRNIEFSRENKRVVLLIFTFKANKCMSFFCLGTKQNSIL